MKAEMMAVKWGRGFEHAARVHTALTAYGERRLLQWIAQRMPRWVTSDQLTVLGLGAQVGAGVCFAFARYGRWPFLLVCVFVVLNWFGDSMDGTLARVRAQQRPRYGFYVDHVIDIFGALAMMTGLGFSGLLHPQIAAAMLVTFLLLSAESYLATYTLGRFELSQGIFGPTEIRILLITGTLAALRNPSCTIFGERWLLFDVGGGIAAVCMLLMVVYVAVRHTATLYREEPLA
jgi:archaetidylinositol phosphate synthase